MDFSGFSMDLGRLFSIFQDNGHLDGFLTNQLYGVKANFNNRFVKEED
jgi:hypothetical protein